MMNKTYEVRKYLKPFMKTMESQNLPLSLTSSRK